MAKKNEQPANEPANEEKAVAQVGLGMGGLGQFSDAAAFQKAIQESAGEVAHGTATAAEIKDAMGKVKARLEPVKVKHGGVCLFQFPDGTKVPELRGVVVAYTYHNSFFQKAFDQREEGERPPCFSNDGSTVSDRAEKPQAKTCGVCPLNCAADSKEARENAFGLNRSERCHNYLTLAVALPGQEVPVSVRLSNSSFKTWAAYCQAIGTRGRFLPYEVATLIKLANRTNQGGAEFSVAEFTNLGPLPAELAKEMKARSVDYRSLLRNEAEKNQDGDGAGEAAAAVAAAKAAQTAAREKPAAM